MTAGPTYEPIDAVRFIGNRSSGRMGLALVTAARARGWPVTLLLGPTALPEPAGEGVTTRRFQTAGDLERLLRHEWPAHDALLMAAAVADYRTASPAAAAKLPRMAGRLTLELEPTPDLLAALRGLTRPGQTTIGFALEPRERLEPAARRKLAAKGLDAIVANPLETMEAATISATLYLRDGRALEAPRGASKADFAVWLLDRLQEMRSPGRARA